MFPFILRQAGFSPLSLKIEQIEFTNDWLDKTKIMFPIFVNARLINSNQILIWAIN